MNEKDRYVQDTMARPSMAGCSLRPVEEPENMRALQSCHTALHLYEALISDLADRLCRILEPPNPICEEEREGPMCTALGRDIQEVYQRINTYNRALTNLMQRINL
jgi:Mg2+ and Co2+ transporter CorA